MSIYELIPFGARFEDTINIPDEPSDPEIGVFRSLLHFYDPQNGGRGLSPFGNIFDRFVSELGLSTASSIQVGYPSLVWAVEGKDLPYDPPLSSVYSPAFQQQFAFGNARNYFYNALTTQDPDPVIARAERNRNFGLMFQTLGHIVHHFQDMGQPQHVRNDPHLPTEDDFYETFVKEKYQSEGLEEIVQLFPYKDGERIMLPRAVDYGDWKNDTTDRGQNRIGMAEFTSTNFISADRNFIGDTLAPLPHLEYPLPVATTGGPHYESMEDAYEECDVNRLSKFGKPVVGEFKWYETDIVDGFLGPDEQPQPNKRTTTHSIWYKEIESFRKGGGDIDESREYAVNECVFVDRLNYVIPRVVAFTSGFIDFFFRGEMEIGAPDNGLYGFIDLNQPHEMNAEGTTEFASGPNAGEPFGYEKINLKLKNTTPDIELPEHFSDGSGPNLISSPTVPQDIFEGELRAVIKYQPNYCYQFGGDGEFDVDQDLSYAGIAGVGTISQSECSASTYFTGREALSNEEIELILETREQERIVVSAPILVGGGNGGIAELPKNIATSLEFDFSGDPLPVNARDVQVQVVYRGKLGPREMGLIDETLIENDAVVVATRDISEPTAMLFANGTDSIWLSPHLIAFGVTESTTGTTPADLTLEVDGRLMKPGTNYVEIFVDGSETQSSSIYGSVVESRIAADINVNNPHPIRFGMTDAGVTTRLQGAEISGTIYPRIEAATDIEEVALFLDEQTVSFVSHSTPPFDFDSTSVQSDGFDTAANFPDGEVVIRSQITHSNGKTTLFDTKFVVNNSGESSPELTVPTLESIAVGEQKEFEFFASDVDSNDISIKFRGDEFIERFGSLDDHGDGNATFVLRLPVLNPAAATENGPRLVFPHETRVYVTASDGTFEQTKIMNLRILGEFGDEPSIVPSQAVVSYDVTQTETDNRVISLSKTGLNEADYELEIGAVPVLQDIVDISSDGEEGMWLLSDLKTRLQAEWTDAGAVPENLNPEDMLYRVAHPNGDMKFLAWPPDSFQSGELTPLYLGPLDEGRSELVDTIFYVTDENGFVFNDTIDRFEGLENGKHMRLGFIGDYRHRYHLQPVSGGYNDRPTCTWVGGNRRQWYHQLDEYQYTHRAYSMDSGLTGFASDSGSFSCLMLHQSVGGEPFVFNETRLEQVTSHYGSRLDPDARQIFAQ